MVCLPGGTWYSPPENKPSTMSRFPSSVLWRLFSFWLAALLLPVSLQAQTPWVDSARLGTEARFLYGNTVRRFDLSTQAWLAPVTLPRSGATAMTWDATDCYIAYGAAIYRYAPGL